MLLLVCSVGGSPEAVAASIRAHQPQRLLLWCSERTKPHADQACTLASFEKTRTDREVLRDPEDLATCVEDARTLTDHVTRWCDHHGEKAKVLVDFTGGTKIMSAALALVSQRWPCEFSYIGGTSRTKDGTGVVQPESEQVKRCANPMDLLGYQRVDDAIRLFNQGLAGAAASILDPEKHGSGNTKERFKQRVARVRQLLAGYANWDAFRHRNAAASFNDALKNWDAITESVRDDGKLEATVERHKTWCERLLSDDGQVRIGIETLRDLLANAKRRAALQLFDDAVARLYRVIEGFAQWKLLQKGIDASNVEICKLPPGLREKWERCAVDGRVRLGLQDAYELLRAEDPDAAEPFFANKLETQTSPLVSRNQSVLAHGWSPVTKASYEQLEKAVGKLLGDLASTDDLNFPRLESTREVGYPSRKDHRT
ncbi:MAG: TIGR02710 family CRISPR-associated CARF protein [Tepidisphaerales bacterium]